MSAKEIKKAKQAVRRRRAVRGAMHTLSISLGSCLALNGGYHRRINKIIHTSDADAIRSDWQAIGGDIFQSMDNFDSKRLK